MWQREGKKLNLLFIAKTLRAKCNYPRILTPTDKEGDQRVEHWYILWLWHFPFSVSSFPFSILLYVLVYCGLRGRKASREGWLRISCISSAHTRHAAALPQGRSSLESGWGGLWLCSRHPLSISATNCRLNVRGHKSCKVPSYKGWTL